MSAGKASSRLRLQCAQLFAISLQSCPPDKLTKGVMEIESKKVNALDSIENSILKCLSGVSICTFVLVKQVLFVIVNRTNPDSFSDTKCKTRVAAYICHDKYSEL